MIFYQFVDKLEDSSEKKVLIQLLSMFGANLILKYSDIFHKGKYFHNSKQCNLYEEGILNLLPILKGEAASLVDAIAPTDFILNSVLGMSDGNVRTSTLFYYFGYQLKL